uniref:Arf-GAP with coiled-coil, ANK repeat and PH domain-containing protein n=1 Tax=Aquila chrysaetos chrysaetos TaxID=223781 RepID=A0A663FIC6_AQUCH
MTVKLDFEECLRDSPWFRAAVEEAEADVAELETHLEKVLKLCSAMLEAGRQLEGTSRAFAAGLRELAGIPRGDPLVREALEKFCDSLEQMMDSHEELQDSTQVALRRHHPHPAQGGGAGAAGGASGAGAGGGGAGGGPAAPRRGPAPAALGGPRSCRCFGRGPGRGPGEGAGLCSADQCDAGQEEDRDPPVCAGPAGSPGRLLQPGPPQGHQHPAVPGAAGGAAGPAGAGGGPAAAGHGAAPRPAAAAGAGSPSRATNWCTSNGRGTPQQWWWRTCASAPSSPAPTSSVASASRSSPPPSPACCRQTRRGSSEPGSAPSRAASPPPSARGPPGTPPVSPPNVRGRGPGGFGGGPPESQVLETVLGLEGNGSCCDCREPAPAWASVNLGITLCIECSGIHRSLGVHFSKVRSLTLDSWEPELVKLMCELGNSTLNRIYEARVEEMGVKRPPPGCSRAQREDWIRAKYVEKKFVTGLPGGGPRPRPSRAGPASRPGSAPRGSPTPRSCHTQVGEGRGWGGGRGGALCIGE